MSIGRKISSPASALSCRQENDLYGSLDPTENVHNVRASKSVKRDFPSLMKLADRSNILKCSVRSFIYSHARPTLSQFLSFKMRS